VWLLAPVTDDPPGGITLESLGCMKKKEKELLCGVSSSGVEYSSWSFCIADALGSVIATNPSITTIDMTDSNIGDYGAEVCACVRACVRACACVRVQARGIKRGIWCADMCADIHVLQVYDTRT